MVLVFVIVDIDFLLAKSLKLHAQHVTHEILSARNDHWSIRSLCHTHTHIHQSSTELISYSLSCSASNRWIRSCATAHVEMLVARGKSTISGIWINIRRQKQATHKLKKSEVLRLVQVHLKWTRSHNLLG